MGVPRLFKIILDKFPESHAKVEGQPIDYLFIDFNSIIYEAYEKIKAQALVDKKDLSKSSKATIERKIISKVLEITEEMITKYVNPLKMVYIALDGPPPRGKMTQQRDRRYKRLYENFIQDRVYQKYDLEPIPEPWSTSYITPGTTFMLLMSQALNQAILRGRFPRNIEYVLSDASVPGEGEHKFLKFIDQLPPSSICIYSNDGDVIMLINRFTQHKSYILTKPKDTSRIVQKNYQNEKYMYLVVDGLTPGLVKNFSKLDFDKIDVHALKRDYIFFTMLGGNDFVQHLYFLRMKEEHSFKVLKGVYQLLQPKYGYLVDENLNINQKFLEEYLIKLAQQERKWLIEKQKRFEDPEISKSSMAKYKDMMPWEKEWEIFQHTYYYKESHPLYEKYREEFNKIDYKQQPNWKWKTQYYQEFFGIDYKNKKILNQICFDYLKSWYFALHYYLDEVPSWRWFYPYHASPLPSDILTTIKRIKDINKVFKFQKGKPYQPLEQLAQGRLYQWPSGYRLRLHQEFE